MEQGTVTAPQPVRPAQAAGFDFEEWIRILCSQVGMSKSDIPAEVMEILGKEPTKNDVNKLFFQWHTQFAKPKQEEIPEDLKSQFGKIITAENHPEYQQALRSISSIQTDVDSYHAHIVNRLRDMARYQDKIMVLEGKTEMDLWPEIEKCLAGGWYTLDVAKTMEGLRTSDASRKVVVFRTPRVNLSFYNKKAGIEQNVDMGSFEVHWHIRHCRMEVYPGEGNVVVDSAYIHPHVSSSRSICWGNASQVYTDSCRKFAPFEALNALRVILQTYNDESPYVGIEKWVRERAKNPRAGQATIIVPSGRKAWINFSDLPDSWATTFEHDHRIVEDEDGDDVEQFLMGVFHKVYESDGTPVPGEEEVFYVRTRNGRNYMLTEYAIQEWE